MGVVAEGRALLAPLAIPSFSLESGLSCLFLKVVCVFYFILRRKGTLMKFFLEAQIQIFKRWVCR